MRDFLKNVLATLIGLILFSLLGASSLVLLLVTAASFQVEETTQLEDKTMLVYDLSLVITDRPLTTGRSISFDLDSSPSVVSLRSLLNAIHEAARDDKIAGIYLLGGQFSPGAGYATLREVRDALSQFSQSGKPIYAYNTDWNEREYYLASVADSIAINPIGSLTLDGFQAEVQFYAGALEKYGIGVQIIRVGKYKSAVEPFVEKAFSPANRQQTEQLLTDLWQELLAGIGAERELEIEELQAIVNQNGLMMPEEAKEAGLIDDIKYLDEIEAELKTFTGTEAKEFNHDADLPFPTIDIADYVRQVDADNRQDWTENRIAIVYAEGEIVNGSGGRGLVGSKEYIDVLQKVRNDPDVKAVVLRINSPGGSATAAGLIEREVKLLQAEKPVIVSMGNLAASGGYWIAAPAQTVIAEPTTITGSIGVFGLLPNFEKLANDNGITWDSIKTGAYANIDTIARPKTAEELALYQKFVDDIYEQFITSISTGREIPEQAVKEIAQGRVWSGVSAQDVQLVDNLGGLMDAIQAAADAAEIGANHIIDEYPRTPNFQEEIIERIFGDFDVASLPFAQQSFAQQSFAQHDRPLPAPIVDLLQGMEQDWELLTRMDDPRNTYTRLPYRLDLR